MEVKNCGTQAEITDDIVKIINTYEKEDTWGALLYPYRTAFISVSVLMDIA